MTKQKYKQTEIGEIPEDWDTCILSECIERLEAGISVNSVKEDIQLGHHTKSILKTSAVKNGKFFPSECKGITPADIHRAKLNPLANTIIFSRMNTPELVGECGYINKDYSELYLPDRLWMSIFKKESKVNVPWLSYLLSYTTINKKIKESATGTSNSMKNISKNSLLSIVFPYPDPKEQTAIATVLSDTDELITSLDKLITKKKAIKQGAMQELLTGKKRLPGFEKQKGFKQAELGEIPDDWEIKTFSDVIEGFSSGQTPYRAIKEYYSGQIPWITSGELNYNMITDTIEKITKEAVRKTNLKILPIGTFIFAITGLEAEGTRGSCAITGIEATTNQSCMALYPKKGQLITKYLFYYYVQNGDRLALEYCQGTKQQSYTARIAKKLPITFPINLEEQTAIATILSDMDSELESLEKKRDKYLMIKQGMMQQLLTGKIRLI